MLRLLVTVCQLAPCAQGRGGLKGLVGCDGQGNGWVSVKRRVQVNGW
jgi:hypothetical protein